ncbi:MAG: tRNA threonylcarbamoyladenosine dehydratase [Clostridia bacterium]|nr:tRNA threonylcarbamoyladenosine dehydratase [Clostridia bacterium]
MENFERTAMLLGDENMQKLKNAHIAVFGIGGVGGHCALSLARCGIGKIDLIDNDVVSKTNINRQAVAYLSTIGKKKTDVMRDMIKDINENVQVNVFNTFFLPENADDFDFSKYDYIIDAIDTVSGKIALVECANKVGTPIISCMGTGNKLDPTAFMVSDINKTSVCPLARVMRKELKARGIKKLKVVYSQENAKPSQIKDVDSGKPIPASISFVPSVAGLIMSGEVVKDLTGVNNG